MSPWRRAARADVGRTNSAIFVPIFTVKKVQ